MKPKQSCLSRIRTFFKKVCLLLLTLVVLVLIPPLLICLILIYTYRYFIIHFARTFKPEFGKIMTARSSLMATDDIYGKPKGNLLIVLVLEGRMPIEELKRDFLARLVNLKDKNGHLVHPELQQYIQSWMGYLFWKWDPKFTMDRHLFLREELMDNSSIDELSTELLKRPFPNCQSPWEILIFPNCKLKSVSEEEERNPKTLILFHLHHSMADGFSVIKLLAGDMALEQKVDLATPNRIQRSIWRKVWNSLTFVLVSPYEMVSSIVDAWDTNQCHIPENKLSENILLAFSERIPISRVKEIKNAHNTSFTTLLLSAFTGAVRDLMLQSGFRVPEYIHCVLPLPISGHPQKLRNFMTTCFLRLPTGNADPLERLTEIEAHLSSLKKSTLPVTMAYLLPIMGVCPVPLSGRLFKQYYTTALISNFPGPTDPVTYAGHVLQEVMFTAGLLPGNIGIGFNTLSYNGYIRIQAAFNESIPTSTLPLHRTFLLNKVLDQLHTLSNQQLV